MKILSTKLTVPALRSRLVARLQLFDKLDQGMESGFVLVSAPAGYGKSTLVSDWLSRRPEPAAWISLEPADNEPVRFLSYLAAGLQRVEPAAEEALNLSLQAPTLPGMEILLTPLVNQLSQSRRPFWLVLDDYHNIHSQVIHQAVQFLLDHRPAALCLVIATRADPPISLSRLRGRGQVVELRMADLRFSSAEIAEFLRQEMELRLSDADLEALEASTEGWIAGLQMAALSMQGRQELSGFIRSFSGENRYILDYLFEEVFQRQPAPVQKFLLETSILGRFCASLCEAVTAQSESQALLEALERGNLFLIALDEHRQWYRYHHLFGDLLSNRLKQAFPEERLRLHQRASAWFEAQRDLENAISHSLAAQDYERAAGQIEQAVQGLDLQNQQTLLSSWVDSLPHAVLENHPWLCVHRAWGRYWTGRREMEEEWLQAAERSLQATTEQGDPENQHIQGHIAAVRAHTAIVAENIPRALEMGQRALALLPEGDEMRCETAIALGAAYWALGDVRQSEQAFGMVRAAAFTALHPSMLAPGVGYMGLQQVKQGHLQEALATFREGLQMAVLPDGRETLMAGFLNLRLGDVLRERNDMASAGPYLERALQQCIRLGQPDVLTDVHVCLGRYHLAVGDIDSVNESLHSADQVAQRVRVDHWVVCWLDDLRVRAWLAEGDLEAAVRWVRNSGLTTDDPLSYQRDLHHQNLARVLVAQGLLEGSKAAQAGASALLDRLLAAAQQAGWVDAAIKILLLQAVNDRAGNKDRPALQRLEQALLLAEPGGFVRVFLDEGQAVQVMLERLAQSWRKQASLASHPAGESQGSEPMRRLETYSSALLSAFGSRLRPARLVRPISESRPTVASGLVEPLSPREREVLALLAQGCSDKQIAENLVIAPETVHKHLKNIYGKLDVHRRTEALARARQLGLL